MSQDWWLSAACAGVDPEAPFAGEGTEEEAAFVRVCNGCPVAEECLQWALRFDDVGIFGGLNRAGRRRLQAGKGRLDVAVCGTDRAYHRHRRRGEPPCDPCKRAHADTTNVYYRGKREREKAAPTDTGRCGTHAGYQAHLGRGQTACGPCDAAAKAYRAQRAAQRVG